MKKFLKVFPAIFLFYVLVSNIYGFSFEDFNGTTVTSDFNPYEEIEKYNYYIIEDTVSYSSSDGTHRRLFFYFFNELPVYNGTIYWSCNVDGATGYQYSLNHNKDSITRLYEYNVSSSGCNYYTNQDGIRVYDKFYIDISLFSGGNILENNDTYSVYHNFDITYNNMTRKAVLYGDLQVKPSIEFNCDYSADNTSATLSASIKNGYNGLKLYYSDDVIFNSGNHVGSSGTDHGGGGAGFGSEVDNLFKLYNTPLIYNNNKVVTFRIYDSNNSIICQSSYNINQIDSFNSDDFFIGLSDDEPGCLLVTPMLTPSINSYYNIYCAYYTSTNDVLVTTRGSDIHDSNYEDKQYYLISNNDTITFRYTGNKSTNILIWFEIRNKSTGKVVLKKHYDYDLSAIKSPVLNDSTENDNPILGGNFSNLNGNSSINDILETSKTTFSSFGAIFEILPGFVWAFLGTALIVLIVLRILGR